MKLKIIVTLISIAVTFAWQAGAQTYDTNNVVVQTFAGSGFSGHLDGQGTQTMFNFPAQTVADSSGNLFVVDGLAPNCLIRKIAPDGTVTTFAGGGGSSTGYGTNVALSNVESMTIDHSNVLWVIQNISFNRFLTRIGPDSYMSQSTGLGSSFQGSSVMCVDSANNLYFSATDICQIYRQRTNGNLELFVGSGNVGSADGNGVFTSFFQPRVLTADAADNIYVWDSGNVRIRRINQNRDVVTITGHTGTSVDGQGLNANFSSVSAMSSDESGNIILACGSSIRKMTATTNVVTIAGSFTQTGYTNGTGSLARFFGASGVCISQGVIFVADSNNQRIRQIGLNPAPVIRRQPQPQVSCLGQGASFRVTAAGVQPLFYQWLHNSVPLDGQTSTNLLLTNLVGSQAGAYSVIVSNQFSAVTSGPAQLVINDACVNIQLYAGLTMSGLPGAAYVLSYTTNLSAPINWLPLATNTMQSSGWLYIDTNTPFSPQRFYQVHLNP